MSNNWLTDVIAREAKYDEGYEAGKASALDALREGIESFLTDDDTDVIISDGEVFVPISALRKIVSNLEVK